MDVQTREICTLCDQSGVRRREQPKPNFLDPEIVQVPCDCVPIGGTRYRLSWISLNDLAAALGV